MARSAGLSACEEQAIAWLVEMRSGAAGAPQRAALAQWLEDDERHRQAWQRLGGALDTAFGGSSLAPLPHGTRAEAVGGTLERAQAQADRRRRLLRGALSVAGVGVGSAWLAQGSGLLPDWRADLHTATGERRSVPLADGSRLDLDARTSVDLAFGDGQRLVRLREGQLLAQVQPWAGSPFVVQSRHGQVRAAGGRVMVRQEEGRTLALALAQEVELHAGGQRALLAVSRSAYLDGQGVTAVVRGDAPNAAAAWVHGMLHADNLPLGEVLTALKPYRLGFIRVSPEAARLRVTGVYGLDDSDATLQALAETLPVAVHRHSAGWLVRVDLAG